MSAFKDVDLMLVLLVIIISIIFFACISEFNHLNYSRNNIAPNRDILPDNLAVDLSDNLAFDVSGIYPISVQVQYTLNPIYDYKFPDISHNYTFED